MGTNKFQKEYIEYLEESNASLHNKLVRLKEFEQNFLSRKLPNNNFGTTVKEITNVCNSTCEAIDNLFENLTATMNSFKTVLFWKSQVLQIPKKLSGSLHPAKEIELCVSPSSDVGTSSSEFSHGKNGKKCGTAKVSPMVKGHVISAPRIHLNRVSEDFVLQTNNTLPANLSPILERSPEASPQGMQSPIFRDIRIPLRRLEIENFGRKINVSETAQSSRRSRRFSFVRKKQDEDSMQKRLNFHAEDGCVQRTVEINESDEGEKENEDAREETDEDFSNEDATKCRLESVNNSEEVDPLEGPSWLLDRVNSVKPSESSSSPSSFHYKFINFRRPNFFSLRHERKNNEKKDVLNFNDDAQMGNFEFNLNDEDKPSNVSNNEKDIDEDDELDKNDGSSSDHSIMLSLNDASNNQDSMNENISESSNLQCRSLETLPSSTKKSSLKRKSNNNGNSLLENGQKSARKNSNSCEKLSQDKNNTLSEVKNFSNPVVDLSKCCLMNLDITPSGSVKSTPKRLQSDSNNDHHAQEKCNRISSRLSVKIAATDTKFNKSKQSKTPDDTRALPPKRRAALECIQKKNWMEVTPKEDRKGKKQKKKGK